MTRHLPRLILLLVVLLYLAVGALYAINTPPWQAPDEPAHYNYVSYLAAHGDFPVLQMGDYPHDYLRQIKAAGFPPQMSIASIRYEAHQPPLYYVLARPVYRLTGGALLPLRLFSVLLGAGIVVMAYLIALRVCPGAHALALGTAALVAFLPQHLVTTSQVGNDVLAELLLALALYQLLGWPGIAPSRPDPSSVAGRALALGITLGLILITKTTAYIAIPLAGGVLVWGWLRTRPASRLILSELALVVLPAALLALPWYARNIAVYGWPDFLGLLRHDAIVVGQTRTADYIAQVGWNGYWTRAFTFTFQSFWGMFGWLGVPMDERVYTALAVACGIAAAGLVFRAGYYVLRRENRKQPLFATQSAKAQEATEATQLPSRDMQLAIRHLASAIPHQPSVISYQQFAILALSTLLTLLSYIWYNLQFVQHQGRYLFTALIPLALAFALGWDEAMRRRSSWWIVAALLAVAAIAALTRITGGQEMPKWTLAFLLAASIGLFARRWLPDRFQSLYSALPYLALPLLALYGLFGVIVPALS